MSTTTLTAPAAQPAMFPPPAVPLLFTDGDRYEWTHTGDVWTRADGWWVPSSQGDASDDGTGWWTDAEVSASLGRAVERWNVRQRFVPAGPGATLPGTRLHSVLDLESLKLPRAQPVAQYLLDHQDGQRLVPARELVAAHDDDAAYDFAATITVPGMLHVLEVILAEQQCPEVSYDDAAERLYARYQRHDAGSPPLVTCLHVFLPAGSPEEV